MWLIKNNNIYFLFQTRYPTMVKCLNIGKPIYRSISSVCTLDGLNTDVCHVTLSILCSVCRSVFHSVCLSIICSVHQFVCLSFYLYAYLFFQCSIYIYAFSRCFYPKRLTVHSGYTFFCQHVCSLGVEPTNVFAANTMLYHWATGTLYLSVYHSVHLDLFFYLEILSAQPALCTFFSTTTTKN